MKFIRLLLRYSILLLCLANSAVSQDLIFSNDTAIIISCENIPPAIDSHWIYNTSDQGIALRWQRVENQIPDESFYLMIFNGVQYPPFTNQGLQFVDAHDSTNIIFEFWHTHIVPGDSVILRIKIYDESDSLNTTHYQTVIQYCPLQTSNADPTSQSHLSVYPNPVQQKATVILPAFQNTSLLVLYSMTGHIVRQLPVTTSEMVIERDGLPNGMYFLTVVQEGRIIHMSKLAIAD